MYAIRKRKSMQWVHHINYQVPITSTKRIRLEKEIPILFEHEELARIEMLVNHMSKHAYEIVEVEICVKIAS